MYTLKKVGEFDDQRLCEWWDKLVKTGVAQATFYDELVVNGKGFCTWSKRKSHDLRFVMRENKILAMFWLNNFIGKTAMIHFCYCREAFAEQMEIGRFVVDYILHMKSQKNGEYILDALTGITPKPYRHALKFIDKLGFEQLGVLPNACFFKKQNKYKNAILSILTRESNL